MAKQIGTVVFALKAYSIRQLGKKFYVARTAAFDDSERWSKGYASLQAACAAIARKLAEEWLEREKRQLRFYARKGRTR